MDDVWNKVVSLDLRSVRAKFEFRKGWWWRMGHSAHDVEEQYRQFLYLVASHPRNTVVPWSHDLDDFWHEHILSTAKYAADCDAIMGGFIHHNPHLPEGSAAHTLGAVDTRRMYEAAFDRAARKKRRAVMGTAGCASNTAIVFCDAGPAQGHAHGGGHSHGHDGGHADAGGGHADGGGGHGCSGHGCGGHGCGGGGH